MTTQSHFINKGFRILREVRRHETLNEKVLAAVQMKVGRDIGEQEILGAIYEHLGCPREEGELNPQWSPM